MAEYLVVIINTAAARFFVLEPVEFPQFESGPRLVACDQMTNPECNLDPRDVFADSKTGRGSAPGGGPVHGFDDKRDQYSVELRRKFAVKVMNQIASMAGSRDARVIVLAVSAKMRSLLFPAAENLVRQGYKVIKLSKNMANFTPQQIHQYLARAGVIPDQRYATA
jgi:hypothetical protein